MTGAPDRITDIEVGIEDHRGTPMKKMFVLFAAIAAALERARVGAAAAAGRRRRQPAAGQQRSAARARSADDGRRRLSRQSVQLRRRTESAADGDRPCGSKR